MKRSGLFLVQCVVLGVAMEAGESPQIPSYKFGLTGEPTEVDTAFGNLGKLGPIYEVPKVQNGTLAVKGNQTTNTTRPATSISGTSNLQKPLHMVNSNSSNEGYQEAVKTTIIPAEGGHHEIPELATPIMEASTTNRIPHEKLEIEENSTISSTTQTLETASISTAHQTNSTNYSTNVTVPTVAVTSSTTQNAQSMGTNKLNITSTTTTPPGKTFKTELPTSTENPTTLKTTPGHNDTHSGQNSTSPSKPNSSSSTISLNKIFFPALVIMLAFNVYHP